MAYKKFTTETENERVQKVLKLKPFNSIIDDIKKIDEDNIESLKYCLMNYDFEGGSDLRNLALLVKYANSEEIPIHYFYLRYISRTFKHTEEQYILRYGEIKGKEFWKKRKEFYSENSKKNTVFSKKNLKEKYGYSEKEAEDKKNRILEKSHSNRDYSKMSKKLKFSIDYWKELGFTEENAEIMRQPHLKPMLTDLESFIERYGEVKGQEKFKEKREKREKTIEEKYGCFGNVMGEYNRASNQSLDVFIPLLNYLGDIEVEETWIGYKDSKELLLHDLDNPKKVYFYDFYYPPLNVIIEFNGVQWHVKDYENFLQNGVLKDKIYEIEKYDEAKRRTAIQKGFNYLEIWNDESIENNLQKCKDFLEGLK